MAGVEKKKGPGVPNYDKECHSLPSFVVFVI